jgi:hypothetical protein
MLVYYSRLRAAKEGLRRRGSGRQWLTLRDVRRVLEDALGAPRGSLDCAEAKEWVAAAVQQALQHAAERGRECVEASEGSCGASSRCDAAQLPMLVIVRVLGSLDDDQDLANALATCRAWRGASDDASLWQSRMSLLRPVVGKPMAHDEAARAAEAGSKLPYQRAARGVCYDCRRLGVLAPRLRVPLSAPVSARLSVRLCDECCASCRHTRPQQRLITHGTAQFRFRLRLDEDLAPLPSALAANPIDDRFVLMRLSRLSVVRCAAIRRWGSEEEMLRHMRQPHWEE